MRLARLAETTEAVRATSSRKAKSELLADLFRRLEPAEIVPAIGFLLATPRQGAIGVGWATVARLEEATGPAGESDPDDRALTDSAGPGQPPADVLAFDTLLSDIAVTTGTGSEAARAEKINRFLTRCSPDEAEFVRRVLVGDARQGALAGVMTDAVAKAAGIKLALMRRAVMLRGDLGEAAVIALIHGVEAVEAVDLEVGRPIQPMLASTAADVAEALEAVGPASVEWKLDGARIQVHIGHPATDAGSSDDGDKPVAVYTRNLNDVTDRLPQVVDVARSLPCRSAVLDGEVLGFFGDENPQAFQDTMSAIGTTPGPDNHATARGLRPYFFDVMYLDGASLIDHPLDERLGQLHRLAPDHVIPQLFTEDPDAAAAHLDAALGRGHEGVMVKASSSGYEAGRRGKSWRKVKPVHTLDLVVLAVEWGHGRRRGWLSNLHLGARDPDGGEFIMVGKTFKGLTDELLRWQTEQFKARQIGESDYTVYVRPELVVEIALDGAQASTRYPGGVALRFARVRGYRPDRDPATADTIDAVRKLLPGADR
ncbi:MAG: ATP-dependent DNA ligase [Acidimicrobiales bacterium]